ncbi:MAG: two-component system, NarL family, nitrate/nitrite response regulator NarL [Cryptosporangiaceae bacterium]|nr:two-component system, NarL family, nitrate/nitrite response regulator NarL [Cryptosporangiaceae bacterium]
MRARSAHYMTHAPLSVVVQSPRRPVCDMLASFVAAQGEFTLVGRTGQWPDLIALCKLRRPDAVVADVGGRIGDTIGWLKLLRARCPGVHVLMVYDHLSEQEVAEAREAGVGTLVPYTHGLDGVAVALRRIGAGHQPAGNRLSGRELEILALMSSGHSVPEMAALLDLSPHTVENYKRHLYSKLDVGSQTQAVSRAVSLGLIDRPAPRRKPAAAARPNGKTTLVLVGGQQGPAADRVMQCLLSQQRGFAVERAVGTISAKDRIRWRGHRVLTILVDPKPDDWGLMQVVEAPVVVVSGGQLDHAAITAFTGRGAGGVVSVSRVEDHLSHVLALVADGYTAIQVAPSQAPTRPPGRRADRRTTDPPKLSAREQDILRSVARGHTVRQTALTLGIATKTVENLQAHLFSKLGVHSRVAALNVAQVLGLVQLPAGEAPVSGGQPARQPQAVAHEPDHVRAPADADR